MIYFILKNISKVTNHLDSHESPTYIAINRKLGIGVMSKGSDIQRLYIFLVWNRDQVLHFASHQIKVLFLHLQ